MLSESGEDLLKSGMFSDVKVKCGDQVWQLHKTIICPRCPYFNKAFNGPFMEATTGEITIQDQVPDDINHIIHFLYTGKVSQDLVESRHCDFLKLADFFQIRSLVKEIISMIDIKLNEMAARLRTTSPQLTYLQIVFDDEEIGYLFRAIQASYASDSPSYAPLRDLVKDFIVITGFRITKCNRFLTTLESIPELAVDIIKLLQHSTITTNFPSGCRKCGGKTSSDESVYRWVGKDINKRRISVKRTLRSICGDCKNSY